jgi:hypothetical protein
VNKVLDVSAAEVRHNADWLAPMTFADVARLAANVTVAKLLERDDFRTRYGAGQPISLVEFLYPLMQGMDSVAIEADLELGGTDQTFNLHVGRDLQRAHGQPGQVVLTMPLLRGTDGVQKMSKSLDNGIYLDDPPEAQFGKLMRIPDEVLGEYLRLTTDLDPAEADRLADKAAAGGAGARDVKRRLAREVVTLYHGPEAAVAAEAAFDAGVRQRARRRRRHRVGDAAPDPRGRRPRPPGLGDRPAGRRRPGRLQGGGQAAGQPGRGPARRPAGRLDHPDLDPGGAGRPPADRRPPVPGPPPGAVSVLTGSGNTGPPPAVASDETAGTVVIAGVQRMASS